MNGQFILLYAVMPGSIAFLVWMSAMWWLRCQNFNDKGVRMKDWRKLESQLLSEQIQYHNEATYKALEFYVKVLLAVTGGIAYLKLSKESNAHFAAVLTDAGGWIISLVSALFCLMSFTHQKAKIERWALGYGFWSPLFWNETWFFISGVIIAICSRGIVALLQK